MKLKEMQNKKSFVLYCDQKEMFEHLPPELCKELILHLFRYVNDENPTSDNPILNALFAPIKHQLKRDLAKWEARAETSRENGKLGGRPKKEIKEPKKPNGFKNNPEEPAKPVTVNVTVNDNVSVNVNEKGINKKRLLDISSSEVKNENYLQIAKAFHELFRNNILEANGSTTKIDNAKGEWIEDIRKLIEIDNQSKENLIAVFNFLKKDAFWKSNIQSTSKLREKFDTLLVKANSENKQKNKNGATTDELKELFVKHFK